jgi:hypothetical protein
MMDVPNKSTVQVFLQVSLEDPICSVFMYFLVKLKILMCSVSL